MKHATGPGELMQIEARDTYDLVNLYLSKAVGPRLHLYTGVDNLFDRTNDDFTQSPLLIYAGLALGF